MKKRLLGERKRKSKKLQGNALFTAIQKETKKSTNMNQHQAENQKRKV